MAPKCNEHYALSLRCGLNFHVMSNINIASVLEQVILLPLVSHVERVTQTLDESWMDVILVDGNEACPFPLTERQYTN
jgi:hypothetical protein